jgi:hypothetical protein
MMNKRFDFLMCLCFMAIGFPIPSFAQEPAALPVPGTPKVPEGMSAYTPEKLQRYFRSEAASYEMKTADTQRKLTLRENPILNWHNPERQLEQGLLFAWMDGSRPAALGSIFTYQYKNMVYVKHELTSVVPHALKVTLDGQEVWRPEAAVLTGTEIPANIKPAATASMRVTQMRAIARDLGGKLLSPETPPKELRLLPTPLIQYQDDAQGIVDGGLFALAVGTDPEIIVMIEARKVGDVSKWHLSGFRSHYDGLEMSYQGKAVWNAPSVPGLASTGPLQMPFAKKSYFTFAPSKPLPPAEVLK